MVFVSLEDWDEVWRRNQNIVARLARRFPARRILWVERPVNVSFDVSRLRLRAVRREMAAARLHSPDGLPNVHILKSVKWLPDRTAASRSLNEHVTLRSIRRAMRALGISAPVLWVNPYYAAHLAGTLGERGLIYDVTDDWTSFPDLAPIAARVKAQDERLARAADATIVCSERLRDLESRFTDRIHLVPNGVDIELYRAPLSGKAPASAHGWRSPVLGYAGTLHPNRLDIDLLCGIARAHAPGTVALVGPDFLTERDRRRLKAHPNVVLAGPAPYYELPSIMRRFDVCIAPHLRSDFVESLNPIKLFEYLATGNPIVSTDVAGFRDFPDLVRIANSADDFVRAARESLSEDASLRRARIGEAARNSWDSRVDSIVYLIGKALKAPGHE